MSNIAIHATAFARPSAARLQLTNRGRVVLFVAAVLTIAVLAVTVGSATSATVESGTQEATTSVVVQPGQTLWQIAAAANPDGDIRATVYDIMKLNSLADAGALQMGRELAVPTYE